MDFFATTVWDVPIKEYPFVFPRPAELEAARRALLERSPHVVAVQGAYGVGKTFFAKLYSEYFGEQYPGGYPLFCRAESGAVLYGTAFRADTKLP